MIFIQTLQDYSIVPTNSYSADTVSGVVVSLQCLLLILGVDVHTVELILLIKLYFNLFE